MQSSFRSIQTPVQGLHSPASSGSFLCPCSLCSIFHGSLYCPSTCQAGSCLMGFILAVMYTWNFLSTILARLLLCPHLVPWPVLSWRLCLTSHLNCDSSFLYLIFFIIVTVGFIIYLFTYLWFISAMRFKLHFVLFNHSSLGYRIVSATLQHSVKTQKHCD